ncbi:hypothetical protein ACFWIZ_24070, partial [Streptomyces sp. NPDC127044]
HHPPLPAQRGAAAGAVARLAPALARPAHRPHPPTGPVDLPSHRVLCGAGGVIAENLTGLGGVADAQAAGCSTEVFLFPLRLAGADGGPVRATARITPHAR